LRKYVGDLNLRKYILKPFGKFRIHPNWTVTV
jgi:hypothetical protein